MKINEVVKNLRVITGSKNSIAADAAMAKMVGGDPSKLWINNFYAKEFGGYKDFEIPKEVITKIRQAEVE